MAIKWKSPPPKIQKGGRHQLWAERLEPLQRKPNKWAVVYRAKTIVQANNTANNIRRASGVRGNGYEVIVRGVEVFARYTG